jgi:Bacterial regulatory protein, Fis family
VISVVLLMLDGLDPVRQQRVSLDYAGTHNLSISAVARDPAGAVALVRDGVAAAVLVAVRLAGNVLDEALSTVRVFYARQPVIADDTETRLIMTALRNSKGNVSLVSELLGIPAAEVAKIRRSVIPR